MISLISWTRNHLCTSNATAWHSHGTYIYPCIRTFSLEHLQPSVLTWLKMQATNAGVVRWRYLKMSFSFTRGDRITLDRNEWISTSSTYGCSLLANSVHRLPQTHTRKETMVSKKLPWCFPPMYVSQKSILLVMLQFNCSTSFLFAIFWRLCSPSCPYRWCHNLSLLSSSTRFSHWAFRLNSK